MRYVCRHHEPARSLIEKRVRMFESVRKANPSDKGTLTLHVRKNNVILWLSIKVLNKSLETNVHAQYNEAT